MTPPDPSPGDALRARLDPAASRAMRAMIAGSIDTQAVYVVAKLGIADALALGARTADDLAGRAGADALTLRRVLRYLTRRGVLLELEGGRFGLAPAGELLQTGHPLSLRQSAIRAGEDMWAVTGRLLDAVRTGRTPHEDAFGASFFDRVADTGLTGALAARMQIGIAEVAASLAALDCVTRARTIVDVGGSHGHLLARLLAAQPHARGVLFDRPSVAEGGRRVMEEAGVADRCEIAAGDMFDSVPAGGDLYLLSWVLHDWSDDRAAAILRSCRSAAPDATVLVVEILMPDQAAMADRPGLETIDPFLLDLQMLLLTGGRERTAREYQDLLIAAGYAIDRVIPAVSATRGAGAVQASAGRRGAAPLGT